MTRGRVSTNVALTLTVALALALNTIATFKSSDAYADFSQPAAIVPLNESSFLELLELPNAAAASSNTDPSSVPPRTTTSHPLHGNVSRGSPPPGNVLKAANETVRSPLYDHTVQWDSGIHRPWLDPSAPKPPAMLLLTSFGWNNPNQTYGIALYRGLRTLELYEGIVNHPWFHPTAWDDINSGKMHISNSTRYYVFLDFETCGERNYPRYGHGIWANRDKEGGRGIEDPTRELIFELLPQSKVMQAPHSKCVFFECGGMGPNKQAIYLRNGPLTPHKLAYISVSNRDFKAGPVDQGLPPPVCRKFYLTEKEEHDIKTCNETARPTLISFIGQVSRSQSRRDLRTLRNESGVVVGGSLELFPSAMLNTTDAGIAFEMLAKRSAFSAAPRGDNLFSYRFSEVMACGSIPVVYADDWLLPFGKDLINWTEAAVVIREADTLKTVSILSQISMEQRCRMRQKGLEIYRKYVETARGTINGIIENFELSAASAEVHQLQADEVVLSTNDAPTNISSTATLINEAGRLLLNDQTAQ